MPPSRKVEIPPVFPQLEHLILNDFLVLLYYKELFNSQVRWLLRLIMVSQNLLFIFFFVYFVLFFGKLKTRYVNIFHSNLKCRLRFKDYLEKMVKYTGFCGWIRAILMQCKHGLKVAESVVLVKVVSSSSPQPGMLFSTFWHRLGTIVR